MKVDLLGEIKMNYFACKKNVIGMYIIFFLGGRGRWVGWLVLSSVNSTESIVYLFDNR